MASRPASTTLQMSPMLFTEIHRARFFLSLSSKVVLSVADDLLRHHAILWIQVGDSMESVAGRIKRQTRPWYTEHDLG